MIYGRAERAFSAVACVAVAGVFFMIGKASTAPEPTWSRLCVRAHAEMWAQPQATSIGKDQIAGTQVLLVQVCDAYAFKCVAGDAARPNDGSCGAMPLVRIVPEAPTLQPQTPSQAPSSPPGLLPHFRGTDTAL